MGTSPRPSQGGEAQERLWSATAAGWFEHWAGFGAPAWAVLAREIGLGEAMDLLDVGCGTGEFVAVAAASGARAHGIDISPAMVEFARELVPTADLRVGSMEALPWADDSFDVVVGINAFSSGADGVGALREARRVTRPDGRVAICNWGPLEDREVRAVVAPLIALSSDPARRSAPVGDWADLEQRTIDAGLVPESTGDVDVPFCFTDRGALASALIAIAPVYDVPADVAARAVGGILDGPARRFLRSDGSYRFENRWRYLLTRT